MSPKFKSNRSDVKILCSWANQKSKNQFKWRQANPTKRNNQVQGMAFSVVKVIHLFVMDGNTEEESKRIRRSAEQPRNAHLPPPQWKTTWEEQPSNHPDIPQWETHNRPILSQLNVGFSCCGSFKCIIQISCQWWSWTKGYPF